MENKRNFKKKDDFNKVFDTFYKDMITSTIEGFKKLEEFNMDSMPVTCVFLMPPNFDKHDHYAIMPLPIAECFTDDVGKDVAEQIIMNAIEKGKPSAMFFATEAYMALNNPDDKLFKELARSKTLSHVPSEKMMDHEKKEYIRPSKLPPSHRLEILQMCCESEDRIIHNVYEIVNDDEKRWLNKIDSLSTEYTNEEDYSFKGRFIGKLFNCKNKKENARE
jgi:hypothetical protein|tara:strand:- start:732 stop:1391 length:660 start_codon:yes stop_codon:yes gene_type:complete